MLLNGFSKIIHLELKFRITNRDLSSEDKKKYKFIKPLLFSMLIMSHKFISWNLMVGIWAFFEHIRFQMHIQMFW